ncbi:tagaturonate reductase [Maribacter ulvicola]|uniref:Tagaturonate reductase n=1 Tax=Maribacter ulvicola TaxID=228959 RepID=A0A1N6ZT39_9FLAO|nr:tagaturonate reductase [Maribacter ulvicola]SIR29944.1 tagaturonate reductase [Maribacter ulvicola]
MELSRQINLIENRYPIRIVQFGEGNFLRAFVNYAFHRLNKDLGESYGVVVVQPLKNGMVDMLKKQDGLYTLFLKGISKGQLIENKMLIDNITSLVNPYADFKEYLDIAKEELLEYVISNTTEAGIAFDVNDLPTMTPPNSFPGKLTVLLLERYKFFNGDPLKGLTIIPCELINYNADKLKELVLRYVDLWELGDEFKDWIINHNSFHNTLVDRIVPGYPKDNIEEYNQQLFYNDKLLIAAESFFLWVIQGDHILKSKLPFNKIDLDVKIVDDIQPYRTRKVRILNGAHTALVPLSILYGNTTVRESMVDDFTGNYIKELVFDEIVEASNLDKNELTQFAEDVFDRFKNPFIEHQLSSIAMNSISKFSVRVLPSLLEYIEKFNRAPKKIVFSFACLIRFYKGDWNGQKLPVNDAENIILYFKNAWLEESYTKVLIKILANEEFWGQDLNNINQLTELVAKALEMIDNGGVEQAFKNFNNI